MKRPAWGRIGAAAREVALSVGAILGTICLIFLVAGVVFHVKPLIVRSGSMEPTIATGALALSHTVPADELEVGQIVSVKTLNGTRVTHRIVEIQPDGSKALLTLKGDANGTVDQEVYDVATADRVTFDVPYAGYVVSWTSGRAGVFLGGLLAGGLVLLALRSPGRTRDKHPHDKNTVVGVGAVVLLAGGVLHGTAPAQDTWASWTDGATLTGATAASYTLPAVVIGSCSNTRATDGNAGTNTARHITLTWPAVTGPPTTYAATLSPALTLTSTTFAGTATKTVDFQYDASLAANRSKLVTVTIAPSLTAASAWVGPTDTWQFLTPNNSNQATCGEKVSPTAAISDPDGITRTTAAAMVTYMNGAGGCGGTSRAACGTMSDASTITNVDFILERVQLGVTLCWDGTMYVTDCATWRTGSIASATTWRVPGLNATVYATPGGSFNLQVRVTDTWGNQTTVSRSFTVNP